MIQKSLLYILTMGLIAIVLTACGDKGIDRKLDYSGTEEELGESFGKAMADATPEQQNILRKHQMIVLSVVSLARNSNPMTVDAFVAKKNAEEFQRLSKMSVRELLVDQLGERKNVLDKLIKFKSGALKAGISIVDITPKEATPNMHSIEVDGVISIRNDSDDFNYYFRGCQLALVIDGKQIEKLQESNDCNESSTIESKGGNVTIKFSHRIIGIGEEDIKTFYDSLKDSQIRKIAWGFKPSKDSWIGTSDGRHEVIGKESENFNEELQKITADLAVLKK